MILTFDKEVTDSISALAVEAGLPVSEVVRHALTLYQLALREREGNRLMLGSIRVELP